jgi:hypothetical protein
MKEHEAVHRRVVYKLQSGEQVEICALTLRDFIQMREQCLREYKDRALDTYTRMNLPADEKFKLLREEGHRIEAMTYEDLPRKQVSELQFGEDGNLLVDKNGLVRGQSTVEYVQWWATTPEGLLYCSWLSMRHSDTHRQMTLDDAAELLLKTGEDAELRKIGRLIDELSEATLAKNSSAPTQGATPRETRRQRRAKRRGLMSSA